MIIHTIIADDEAPARQQLRTLLRSESDIEIVGEASSPGEILTQVHEKRPHLLFLDLCMPRMDGCDIVAELIRDKSVRLPQIIVSAAHGQYAMRAFEIHAADYLLKPFTAERLHASLQYARERIQNAASPAARESRHAPQSRIALKSRGRILFLPTSEIRWIAAEENYVRICTAQGSHLLRATMTGIESKLDSQTFMRVHRSAIVNLRHVKEVRRETSGEFSVMLSNGQKVAMSRSHHSHIDHLMNRL